MRKGEKIGSDHEVPDCEGALSASHYVGCGIVKSIAFDGAHFADASCAMTWWVLLHQACTTRAVEWNRSMQR